MYPIVEMYTIKKNTRLLCYFWHKAKFAYTQDKGNGKKIAFTSVFCNKKDQSEKTLRKALNKKMSQYMA